ncbi:MAG: response regulator [Anaerolineales bacterium]|nr:response regulator [Anaerolineales bacterium]
MTEPFAAVELPRSMELAIERTVGVGGDKPISVIAEYPAHLPAVEGNQEELARVIASLISHIIYVTDQGVVHVTAELLPAGEAPRTKRLVFGDPENLSEGGPWALVRIKVRGKVIVAQDLQEIAEEFERTSEQPRIKRDGYSLIQCKDIIEDYGGDLWIEDVPSFGVQVSFALPLRAARYGQTDFTSLHRMVETRLPERSEATKTILLMTEEAGLKDQLLKDLGGVGYQVIAAPDGANVLAMARSEKPDLILLDLDARDPPGFDIATVLKQDQDARDIPVLFITSVADSEHGIQMGAVSFLVRPEGTGKLLSAIESVLVSGISPSSRVLVVESDDKIREAIIHLIQSQGFRVTEARASEEALALAERLETRVVFINSSIAKERDYWILRSLRQLSPDMDIFVLAEVISEEDKRAAIQRGASGYRQTGELSELLDTVRGGKQED